MPQEEKQIRKLSAETLGEFDARRYLGMISDRMRNETHDAIRAQGDNPNSTINRTLSVQTLKINDILKHVEIIAEDTAYIKKFVKKVERGDISFGGGSSFLDSMGGLLGGAGILGILKKVFTSPVGITGSVIAALGAMVYFGAKKAGVSDQEMGDKLKYLFTGDGNPTSDTTKGSVKNATERVLNRSGLKRAAIKIPYMLKDVQGAREAMERAMYNDARGAIRALGEYAKLALPGSEYKFLGTYVIEAGFVARKVYKRFWGIDVESDPIKDANRKGVVLDAVIQALDSIQRDKSGTVGRKSAAEAQQAENTTRKPSTAGQTRAQQERASMTAPVVAASTASAATAAVATSDAASAQTPSSTAPSGSSAAPSTATSPTATPTSPATTPTSPSTTPAPSQQPNVVQNAPPGGQQSPGLKPVTPTMPGGLVPDQQTQPSQSGTQSGSTQPGTTATPQAEAKPKNGARQTPLKGNAAAQHTISYLMAKGWTREQAAGIAGNVSAESSFNPHGPAGDGGIAKGISQWHPDRVSAIENHFGKSLDEMSYDEQLDAIHWELTQGPEKSAGDRLRQAKTAEEAAAIHDQYYERSSGGARQQRMNMARRYYDASPEPTQLEPKPQSPEEKALADTQAGAGIIAGAGVDKPHASADGHVPLGGGRDARGLVPEFGGRVDKMIADAKKQGYGVQIFSGGRTPEYQADLIKRKLPKDQQGVFQGYIDKYGAIDGGARWASDNPGAAKNRGVGHDIALPGHSNHQHGAAADLRFDSKQAQQWVHDNIKKYNLHFRMGYEPWHVEPTDKEELLDRFKKAQGEGQTLQPPQQKSPELQPQTPTPKNNTDLNPPMQNQSPEDALNSIQNPPSIIQKQKPQAEKPQEPQYRIKPADGFVGGMAKSKLRAGDPGPGTGMLGLGGKHFEPVDSIPEEQKKKIHYNQKEMSANVSKSDLGIMKKNAGGMFDSAFDVTPMAAGGKFITAGPTVVPSQRGDVLMGEAGPEQVTVSPTAKRPKGGDLEPSPVSSAEEKPHPIEPPKPNVIDPGHPLTSNMPTRSQHPRPPMSYLLANDLRNHRAFVGNVADYGLSGVTNLLPDQR